ncbi:MAG TPA: outer membrane protein transport protein [Thermoanaerobaculia bacterium]|nr:outer membrane protein transport protein [Thermoanaerobaculia bacterium]
MRQKCRVVVLCLLAAPLGASLASASGFGLFQHGARAIGQAGAFTARASDPSAMTYNPAAITKLNGFQIEAGLDMNNPTIRYTSASGGFKARHIIQFPPAIYVTWRPKRGPFALGLGYDSPFNDSLNWEPRLFPGRFITRRTEVRIYELHPVLAYDLGEGWSVGAGFRYAFGNVDRDVNTIASVLPAGTSNPAPVPVEIERNATADVDATAWDVSVHYAAPSWGWGGVFRSAESLKGNGGVSYKPRDVPTDVPGLDAALQSTFTNGRVRESFEIPREVRAGIWYAPYPELRIELDASFQSWSSLEATDITYTPNPFSANRTETIRRDWKDTTGLRLGIEGNITDHFLLFGGVALEQSPVPDRTIEPGFPYGDFTVYAAGFTYDFPWISFDLAYSYHDFDSRNASRQEPQSPGRTGTYSGRDSVFGITARWRF